MDAATAANMTSQWEKIKRFHSYHQTNNHTEGKKVKTVNLNRLESTSVQDQKTHLYSNPWFSKNSIWIAKKKTDKTHSTFTEKILANLVS